MRAFAVAVALACCVLSIGLLLYVVPPGFSGSWGLTTAGADLFKDTFPLARGLHPLPPAGFSWMLRGLLILAWSSWVGLIVLGFRGIHPPRSMLVCLVVIVAVLLAVFSPPSLSGDVLGYAAKGRLLFVHHLNPYENGRVALDAAGDPAARFLRQTIRLAYGPLWTIVAGGFAAIGSVGGLYGEVVAHKLLAALSLVACAFFGAQLAEGRERGRGPLAFAAIGLNPSFLLEGPATGHNDFMMMALLLWGASLYSVNRRHAGALALGLAVAVKSVALAAVPFLLFVESRRPSRRRTRDLVIALALIAAPTVILSIPFRPLVMLGWLVDQSEGAPSLVARLLGGLLLLASFVWGWWLVQRASPPAWLTGWIPVSAALVVVAARSWYPWYFSWALISALTGWDERHRILILSAATATFLVTWMYTVGP